MEIVFDEAAGRLPLLGGVQDASTRKVVDKIARLGDIGYGHFVVTPTFYIPHTPDEQLRLFAACREAGGDGDDRLQHPAGVAVGVAVETFCEAARRGWMRRCKETSGDLKYLRRLMSEGGPPVRVLMGDDVTASDGLQAGRSAWSTCASTWSRRPISACSPRRSAATPRRWRGGRRRSTGSWKEVVLSGPCFVAGPKYVLGKLGMGRGVPVSPLHPADETQTRRIDRFLGL